MSMWTRGRSWLRTLVGRHRFEGELAVKEEVRDVRIGVWFEQLRQDLGYGLRLIRRDPGLSLGIVVILALALGITTAIWSFADKSLLRPLPFEDAGRLVWLRGGDTQRGFERMPISYQDFLDWRERTRSFEDLAAWRQESRVRSDTAFPERVRVAAATDNLYGLAGTTPWLGSLPRSETDVVLSYAYWNGRLGSDPAIVGSSLRLDDMSFTIVGVLRERFAFPPFPAEYRPEVWISLGRQLATAVRSDRGAHGLWAVGRLAPGTDLDAARIEMEGIALDLERAYPETNRAAGVSLGPLDDLWGDRLQRALPVVLLGAALALLVACSNVVGLLVSRTLRRRREFMVRSALGAGALRLARQLAAEVGLLFVAGIAAGLVLAHAALPLLVRQFSHGGSYLSATPQVDARVFTVMALVAGATGLLTSLGLIAGARPGRGSLSLSTSLGNAPRRSGLRRGLLVVQMGISMVVIFASALLTESLRTAASEPVGFDMANLLALRIETPAELRGESERLAGLLRQIGERADLVTPGDSVALAYSGPFGSLGASRFFEVSQRPVTDAVQPPLAGYRLVSRNYFDVLRIPVLRGRGLPGQSEGVLPVVVNQAFVNRHFGSREPVGAGLRFFSELQQRLDRSRATPAEIVGVVADEKFWRLDGELLPQAYASIESQPRAASTCSCARPIRNAHVNASARRACPGAARGADRPPATDRGLRPGHRLGPLARHRRHEPARDPGPGADDRRRLRGPEQRRVRAASGARHPCGAGRPAAHPRARGRARRPGDRGGGRRTRRGRILRNQPIPRKPRLCGLGHRSADDGRRRHAPRAGGHRRGVVPGAASRSNPAERCAASSVGRQRAGHRPGGRQGPDGQASRQRRGYCLPIAAWPCRRTNFWILPVAVFGNCSTNAIRRGALKCAILSRA